MKELRSIGIQPDIIVCRTESPLAKDLKEKIALFCDIEQNGVIEAVDADTIYEVPLMLEAGVADIAWSASGWTAASRTCAEWEDMVTVCRQPQAAGPDGVVGKYMELRDAYKSIRGFLHGGIANEAAVKIDWVDAEMWRTASRGRSRARRTASWSPAVSATGASRAR